VVGLGPAALHRVRALLRACLWTGAAVFLVSIAACETSGYVRLDWIRGPAWRLYIGEGYVCWMGWDGDVAPGFYVRDRNFELAMAEGDWHGVDAFDVEYTNVPIWWVSLAAIPVIAVTAVALRLLPYCVAPRRCRHCAYDLTGNVSGICPECGQAIRGSPRA
jgi:hypothetical protein